jgi:hypothetical protein
MGKIYDRVEQFVIDSFNNSGDNRGVKHLQRTAYWVKQLRQDANEALLVSAVAHDIERGFRNNQNYAFIKDDPKGFKSEGHLNYHQEEGARILTKYLQQIEVEKDFIEQVKMLVSKHEVGGNDDQNLLKDADSISFFENNIDHFLTNKVLETGKDKVMEKFNWMYERITSPKAKEIVRDWYQDAIKRLNSL